MTAQRGGRTPVRETIAKAPATARTARANPLETIAKHPLTSRATVSRASSKASKAAAKPKPVSVKTLRARLNKQIVSFEQSLQEKQVQLQGINKRINEAKRGKIIHAKLAHEKTAAEAEIQVIQGNISAARESLGATYKKKPKKTADPAAKPVAPVVAETAVQAPSVDADLLAAAGVEAKVEAQRLNGGLAAARKEVARLAGELEAVQKQLEELQETRTFKIERVAFDPRAEAEAKSRIADLEASLGAMQARGKTVSKAADVEELKQRLEHAERTLLEVSKRVSEFLQRMQGGSGDEKTEIVNVKRQVEMLIQIIGRQREHIETLRTRATRAEAAIAAQDTRTDYKLQVATLQKRANRMDWLAIGLFTALGLSNVGWFAYTKFFTPPVQEQTIGYNDVYQEAPRGLSFQEGAESSYSDSPIVEQVRRLGRFEFDGKMLARTGAVAVLAGFTFILYLLRRMSKKVH